jgi:hypothetical protein
MTQDRRRLRDSIEEIVAQIGVFAGVGPAIGATVFSLILLLPESNAPNPLPNLIPGYGGIGYVFSRIAYFVFALFLTTFFSYLLAGVAAAFTGLVVAMASFWIRKASWLFLLAAIVGGISSVVNLFAALVIDVMYSSEMNFHQSIGDIVKNFKEVAKIIFILGAISSVICTYLTKSFRHNERPPSGEVESHPDMRA